MNKQIEVLFTESVTEQGIQDIIAKHDPKLVRDMTNEAEFKEARKVRTEMNKLVEKVNATRITLSTQLKDHGDDLIARIESGYSPTVTPFLVENESRKIEKKRIEEKRKARVREQEDKIADIKGASNRAMHLPLDDLESILQDVCDVDLAWFDDEFRGGAQIAKEVSIGQLNDAFKYLTEKETARQEKEIQNAELADKNDEIEKLKAQLAAMQPEPIKEVAQKYNETLSDALETWNSSVMLYGDDFSDLKSTIERFTTLTITEQ